MFLGLLFVCLWREKVVTLILRPTHKDFLNYILKRKNTLPGVVLVAMRRGSPLANFPHLSYSTLMRIVFWQVPKSQKQCEECLTRWQQQSVQSSMKGKLSGAHQQRRKSSSIVLKRPPCHSLGDMCHSTRAVHWTFKICPSHRVKKMEKISSMDTGVPEVQMGATESRTSPGCEGQGLAFYGNCTGNKWQHSWSINLTKSLSKQGKRLTHFCKSKLNFISFLTLRSSLVTMESFHTNTVLHASEVRKV